MGRSNTATLVLFLASFATVAAVAAFYAMAAIAGWAFGPASASLAVASTLICVTLGTGLYLRHRRGRSDRRFAARLSELNSPTPSVRSESSRRDPEIDESARSKGGTAHTPHGGVSDRTDDSEIHESSPSPAPLRIASAPTSLENESANPVQDLSVSIRTETPEQPPSEESQVPVHGTDTAHQIPEPPEPPNHEPTVPAIDRGATPDAKGLAEILNLYERTGLPPDGHFDRIARDQLDAAYLPSAHLLSIQLVTRYGAESIDLSGSDNGQCRIKLTSGDIVFYSPERGCWLWIAFEQQGPDTRPLAGAPSRSPSFSNANSCRPENTDRSEEQHSPTDQL